MEDKLAAFQGIKEKRTKILVRESNDPANQ
jgi:hypothetical protein